VKPLFASFARPHFVGIGGAGMEALARLVAAMGCRVSGSDQQPSAVLSGLQRDGFEVRVGHAVDAGSEADLVVYSTAVPEDNPELVRARQRGVPLVSRAVLLGAVSRQFLTIAVGGSHGKTTTASMLAAILLRAGWDPGVAIGGWRDGTPQARLGRGRHFVVEADEFRRAFLELAPSWAVVTNVDAEHLDCYADLAAVEAAFAQFLGRLPFYGHAVVAGDGLVGDLVVAGAPVPVSTFGMDPANTWQAAQVELAPAGSRFEIRRRGEPVARVELQVPGAHNVLDALGAAAIALHLGVAAEPLTAALREYAGAARRFEVRARTAGVTVIDDYAHHPTEVAAALAAARGRGGRVLAVFQPHLYSRTRLLHGQFSAALKDADEVFLAPVYGAREQPEPGVGSQLIAAGLRRLGHTGGHLLPAGDEAAVTVLGHCAAGDTVLVMGAGDIDRLATDLARRLQPRAAGG
jgi:UDP-N-acetylmuramate--alanine ligase